MRSVFVAPNVAVTFQIERGIALLKQNRFVEAIDCFNLALAVDGSDVYAHWNKATALFSLGRYRQAVDERDQAASLIDQSVSLLGPGVQSLMDAVPEWRGGNILGARILFYHEAGYGDSIMMLRFVRDITRLGAMVTVWTTPLVVSLMPDPASVVTSLPGDFRHYDLRLSCFGVLRALDIDPVVPTSSGPYLANADVGRGTRKLGLCWSGRTQREFVRANLRAQLACTGYELFSLQPGFAPHGVKPMAEGDFNATRKLMAQMEHIVTVDSAVANLAGAMGHPSAHVLVPFIADWRWEYAAYWYPKLKIYRQSTPGDWAFPIARINRVLNP